MYKHCCESAIFPSEKFAHPIDTFQGTLLNTFLTLNQGVLPKWSSFSNHCSVLLKGVITYLGFFLKTFN